MKKSILITCLVLGTFTLAVFGFNNQNAIASDQEAPQGSETAMSENATVNTDQGPSEGGLFFDVDSRYKLTISKEDLNKARTYQDLYPEDHTRSIVSCSSVVITVLDDWRETDVSESGNSEVLNAAQLKLIGSLDYSSNILVTAQYKAMHEERGQLADGYSTPRFTIVPEIEARPVKGKEALLAYAKEHTKEYTYIVKQDVLRDGRVSFTVSKEGSIKNASLTSTSGYPALDEKMVHLISTMPGNWQAATNAKGEKVEQVFVFFFGLMGC